jgi:hypothetical protein
VPLTISVLETLDESMQRIWSDHTTRSLVAVQKAVEADTGAARSQFTYHAGDEVAGTSGIQIEKVFTHLCS